MNSSGGVDIYYRSKEKTVTRMTGFPYIDSYASVRPTGLKHLNDRIPL